jgi:endonuclease VIII
LPEGDTIFRAARTLNRALAGSIVTSFETQLPALARVDADQSIVGRTIEFASAMGKWMQIGFSGDLVLLTHMLMSGSWHIYRPGEGWQKSRHDMRIVVGTAAIIAVAFNVPVAEFHTQKTLARRRGLNQLGPDLLSSDFDEAEAVARLARHPGLEIGDALLSQSIIAGLGNVFKSEVCFMAQVNPFQRIGNLSTMQLQSVVAIARKALKSNVVVYLGLRRTTGSSGPDNRLWVYHRNGEPCRNCGATIISRKQGAGARTSFWCPVCQAGCEFSINSKL